MLIRGPVIQHSLRRPMYSGVQINKAQKNIDHDIINIELGNTTDTEVNNMNNFIKYCKCKLRQKKLLRDGNYSSIDTIQVDIQNQTARLNYQSGYFEEEYVNGDINPDYDEVETETPESNVENLENQMQNLEINSGSITPEFEDSENCIENDEYKSELNEKTDLQGNDEFNVVNYNNDINECFFDSNNILEANEETVVTQTKDKKIEIIENIVIKHAKNTRNDETLVDNDPISQEDTSVEETETVQKMNLAKQNGISEKINEKHEIIETNDEISQKEMNNNGKVDEIESIASTSKGITTQKTKDTGNLADKSDYNTKKEKIQEFDNFKVPKEVSKKKRVKKAPLKYVLTHVIEGFIIQESNIAFPVSKTISIFFKNFILQGFTFLRYLKRLLRH